MFEGVPNYPDRLALLGGHRQAQGQHLLHRADRDPRADAARATAPVKKTSRKSLRLLGTVGEPINPEAWEWYYRVVGDEPLPDRRHLVADRDRRHPDHAAAGRDHAQAGLGDAAVLRRACRQIVDAEGKVLEGAAQRQSRASPTPGPGRCAPSTATTSASCETYFSTYPGQVLHRRRLPPRRGRLLLDHRPRRRRASTSPATAWAPPRSRARWSRTRRSPRPPWSAIPHDIKGQGIYCLRHADGRRASRARSCARSWSRWVRKEIGPIATPDVIQFAPGLPKTRSGKIMRRILRKIAEDEFGNLGDTSTLADPGRGRRPRQQPAEQEGGKSGCVSLAGPCRAAGKSCFADLLI